MELRDIEDRADCERLVRAFYSRALEDPLIGFFFTDVATIDLDEHVPVVASFWETVLLGADSYRGGAFHPHANLHHHAPMQQGHFERWLVLWCRTVDELFDGPRAAVAKVHALRQANAFHRRLGAYGAGADAGAGVGGGAGEGAEGEGAPVVVTQHGPRAA